MWQRWLALGQRRVKRVRAPRASPHLEPLEQRYVLTNSLVVVPSPAVDGGALFGTAALANNDIWAVGRTLSQAGLLTLAEHFDGNSWQVVPTPSPEHGGQLRSVAAVASDDVWAVGSALDLDPVRISAGSLIEHWDGSSWTIIDSPTSTVRDTVLSGVTAIASNDVWAVGNDPDHNSALVEHWDGSSWSVVSSSVFTGVGRLGLASVSADAGNDVWAFGLAKTGGAPFSGPAVLHFDGTSWTLSATRTQTGPGVGLGSVTALSPTNVWAVGVVFDGNGDPHAAIAHWDGSNWRDVPPPGVDGMSELAGVAAISPTDIWAVGTIGHSSGAPQTLTEHWDGTSWSIIPSPNPGDGSVLFGVTALSDDTVAAVGTQPDVDTGQITPLILQNPESAPGGSGGSGAAGRADLLFADASTGGRWSLAGPGTVSTGALRDSPLLPDPLNARSVDPVFAPGQPDPALRLARDRSVAPQGPEDHLGRKEAIDGLFTEWIETALGPSRTGR
jgi:hypothetical protein